ncbi:MAG TPA: GNAT family N-acetyltransferase [Pyrinomonadaceae bacterium]|jgi:ribosomal protein S18 acetylase RimI-like enzyme
MLEVRVLKGRELFDEGLVERVVELDKRNMRAVWERAGMEYPEENRRKSFASDPTFVVAFDGGEIAGYVEYLRSWNDPRLIYVGSLQVAEKYRRAGLLLRLLDEFRAAVSREDFDGFETSVQKANATAAALYRRLGFRLEPNPRNELSWLARAGREILADSPVVPLLDRWRERQTRRGASRPAGRRGTQS